MTIDDAHSYFINDVFLHYLENANLPTNENLDFISINQDIRLTEHKGKTKIITDPLNTANNYIKFIESIYPFIEEMDVIHLSFLSPRLFRTEYIENLNYFRSCLYKLLLFFGLYNSFNTGNSLIMKPEIIGFLYFMGFEYIEGKES